MTIIFIYVITVMGRTVAKVVAKKIGTIFIKLYILRIQTLMKTMDFSEIELGTGVGYYIKVV